MTLSRLAGIFILLALLLFGCHWLFAEQWYELTKFNVIASLEQFGVGFVIFGVLCGGLSLAVKGE